MQLTETWAFRLLSLTFAAVAGTFYLLLQTGLELKWLFVIVGFVPLVVWSLADLYPLIKYQRTSLGRWMVVPALLGLAIGLLAVFCAGHLPVVQFTTVFLYVAIFVLLGNVARTEVGIIKAFADGTQPEAFNLALFISIIMAGIATVLVFKGEVSSATRYGVAAILIPILFELGIHICAYFNKRGWLKWPGRFLLHIEWGRK
jgi:hypothetical protein